MILFVDYQYKQIGGVQQLIVNTIKELNRRGLSAKVYCSQESFEYQSLVREKLEYDFIDSDVVGIDCLNKYIVNDDVLYITSLSTTELLRKLGPLENKLIFYSVHPETFFRKFALVEKIFRIKDCLKKMVIKLRDCKSLLIMDGANLEPITKQGIHLTITENDYVPVPCITSLSLHRDRKCDNTKTTITYLGRGNAEWKVYPVVKLLQDLNKLDVSKYKVSIITDKDELFEELIAKHVPNNKIYVEYIHGLMGEDLERFIFEKSDLHFAMGTSALEGAKIGIPTIRADISKVPIPQNYKYTWLCDTIAFSLGDEIDLNTHNSGHDLASMLQDIEDYNLYKDLSDKCYQYVMGKHSIKYNVDKILDTAQNTQMTVKCYNNTDYSKTICLMNFLLKPLRYIKHILLK